MPPRLWIPPSIETVSKHWKPSVQHKEARSLYREILRTAKHFHWTDNNGVPWNKRIKEQAKREFLEARSEKDPLILARLLVTGRDCVQQIQNKFNDATMAAWKRIEKDNMHGGVYNAKTRSDVPRTDK
jgi:Complex 1 protein (LYR family)